MNAFAIIKGSVDILDAAGRYGLEVNRHKKALCPFHNDNNPSLSFKWQRFKCFACGAGGDVIDLVSYLANTTPLETVRELGLTYGLRIDPDKPAPTNEVMGRTRQQAEKKAFSQWIKDAGFTLAYYYRLLSDWRGKYAPKAPDDELHPRFIESLHELDYIEYLLDAVFTDSAPHKQTAVYKQFHQMIDRLAQCLSKERDAYAEGIGALDNPSGIVFHFEFAAAKYLETAA